MLYAAAVFADGEEEKKSIRKDIIMARVTLFTYGLEERRYAPRLYPRQRAAMFYAYRRYRRRWRLYMSPNVYVSLTGLVTKEHELC